MTTYSTVEEHEIIIGNKYEIRNGNKVLITDITDDMELPIEGRLLTGSNRGKLLRWRWNGKYWSDSETREINETRDIMRLWRDDESFIYRMMRKALF